MVDNPNNGGSVLLMGQALFAAAQYDDAAGAVQIGMQMLPENEWGNVVKNYTQLYGNIQNYTNELKALETARNREARRSGPAVPVGLSLRLPGLSQAGRSGTGQGPRLAAEGPGIAKAA